MKDKSTLVPKLCLGTSYPRLCFAFESCLLIRETEFRRGRSQTEFGNEGISLIYPSSFIPPTKRPTVVARQQEQDVAEQQPRRGGRWDRQERQGRGQVAALVAVHADDRVPPRAERA